MYAMLPFARSRLHCVSVATRQPLLPWSILADTRAVETNRIEYVEDHDTVAASYMIFNLYNV